VTESPTPGYEERKRHSLLWSGCLSAVGFSVLLVGVRTSTIAAIVVGVLGALGGLVVGYLGLRDGTNGFS